METAPWSNEELVMLSDNYFGRLNDVLDESVTRSDINIGVT